MKAAPIRYKKEKTGFGTLRAAIVEVRRLHAVALAEDGCFIRIRNEDYEVGQTIELRSEKPAAQRNRILAFASMAAALLILVLGGYGSYTAPYGVVSLDVNPSIEYTINIFDRVIGVRAVNADGETILDRIAQSELLHRSVGDAVDATIDQLQQSGYLLESEDNYVMLSASANGEAHAERLAASLQTRVGERETLSVQSVAVAGGDVTRAHQIGTSAGKLYLIDRLKSVSSDPEAFDESAWIDKPVRELIRAYQSQSGKKDKSSDESSNNGGGTNADTPSDHSSASDNAADNGTDKSEEHGSSGDHSSSGGTKKPRSAIVPDYLRQHAS